MKLLPLDRPEMIELVAGWLAEKRNYQWLDFGSGTQILTPAALKIMVQRDIHVVRAFTSDEDDVPIGVVGLNNVERNFGTAMLWVVLGDRKYSFKGCSVRACSKIMTFGFTELGLYAIHAWAVENNHSSLRGIKRLKFRQVGRLRQCHVIDGCRYDRLLFDLLASEHEEM